MEVKLGLTYKDSISGFVGIAIARTVYLYGCERVLLSPTKLKKDGDFLSDCWLDEAQVVKVKATKTPTKRAVKKNPAGPRTSPSRRSDARR